MGSGPGYVSVFRNHRRPPRTVHARRAALRKFPLRTQGLVIVGAFVAVYLWLDGLAGVARPAWSAALGAVTTLILFAQLRLMNNVHDRNTDSNTDRATDQDRSDRNSGGNSVDHTGAGEPAGAAPRRRGMFVALAVAGTVAVLLNAWWPRALLMVVAATVVPLVAQFALPRLRRVPLAVIALVYEAGPALCFGYTYAFWAATRQLAVPTAAVLGGTAGYWIAFQVWKLTRKCTDDTYRPYGLTWSSIRWILLVLLVAGVADAVLLATALSMPPFFRFYYSLVPLLFGAWLWHNLRLDIHRSGELGACSPPPKPGSGCARPGPGRRRLSRSGLAYAVALEAGMLAEVVARSAG